MYISMYVYMYVCIFRVDRRTRYLRLFTNRNSSRSASSFSNNHNSNVIIVKQRLHLALARSPFTVSHS